MNTKTELNRQGDRYDNNTIDFLDVSTIASSLGEPCQVVMTVRAWSASFAPDPLRHSPRQQMEMRSDAPQLRAMIRSLLTAMAGEDRSPCLISFATRSPYLQDHRADSLGLALGQQTASNDFLVLHPFEWWFAEFALQRWNEAWGEHQHHARPHRKHRLEPMLRQLNRAAESELQQRGE